jgi:hypothetical protein
MTEDRPFSIIRQRHPEWARRRDEDIVEKRKAGMSFEAIGRLWDITRERARQIYRAASQERAAPQPNACQHKQRISETTGMGHTTYEVCADCGHRFV